MMFISVIMTITYYIILNPAIKEISSLNFELDRLNDKVDLIF
jgi:hypothetical protein